MKSQNGMSYLMLVICIIIIATIITIIGYFTYKQIEEGNLENYETNMLLIQGKIKVLSQEATIQKNEELLKGRKVSDSLEEEQIKKILENGVISQEEESFSKYYIIEKLNLEEMGLNSIELEEGSYYIVNYDTDEIIYTNGISINGKVYYKLSELKKFKEDKEKQVNEIINEVE